MIAAVALGSNLGDRRAHLDFAVTALADLLHDLKRSAYHETDPVGVSGPQPRFLNAAAVGVATALRRDDYILSTHRGHGHLVAKGGSLRGLMAELYGKQTGCSRGKGGSMHLYDADRRFFGGTGIVGAGIPLGLGLGFGCRYQGGDQVCLCAFGDGAVNTGAFHESLNMAALWRVPLVMICENNGFAISVSVEKSVSVPDIAARSQAFGFPGVVVDGNDLVAVYQATLEAVERARRGEGPTLLECKTVRWERHSAISAGRYASREDMKRWQKTDPIPRVRTYLIERLGVPAAEIDTLEQQARQVVEQAVEFALAAARYSWTAERRFTESWRLMPEGTRPLMLEPPPVPEVPTVTFTSGFSSLNPSAIASVKGATVLDPSIRIVPETAPPLPPSPSSSQAAAPRTSATSCNPPPARPVGARSSKATVASYRPPIAPGPII